MYKKDFKAIVDETVRKTMIEHGVPEARAREIVSFALKQIRIASIKSTNKTESHHN